MSSETWLLCTGTHQKHRPAYMLCILTCKSIHLYCKSLCPREDLNFQLLRASLEHIIHIPSPQKDDLTTNRQGQLWFLCPYVQPSESTPFVGKIKKGISVVPEEFWWLEDHVWPYHPIYASIINWHASVITDMHRHSNFNFPDIIQAHRNS